MNSFRNHCLRDLTLPTIWQPGEFSVAGLQKECPGVSLEMIHHLLKTLRGKEVECLGRGHQARWRRKAIE